MNESLDLNQTESGHERKREKEENKDSEKERERERVQSGRLNDPIKEMQRAVKWEKKFSKKFRYRALRGREKMHLTFREKIIISQK